MTHVEQTQQGPVFVRDDVSTALTLTLCAGLDVRPEDVEDFTDRQIQQAEDWAAAVHIRKTLHDVRVPAMPAFLTPFAGRH